jgi:hypothetical protein
MKLRFLRAAVASLAVLAACGFGFADPIKNEFKKDDSGKWQLLRDGKPYIVKGGGGGYSKQVLVDCGGNSFRTWGTGDDTLAQLDEAQKLGLTVTLGFWLGHKDNGMDYKNAAQVKSQFENAKKAVEKYKDHPAIIMWSMGNEMENGNDTQELWEHINSLAKMVHEIDKNHPVMTVVAEIGGDKVANMNKWAPDLDAIGINTYGGGASVMERYKKAGGTRPVYITEFGPAGTWEIPMNKFGAPNELTSTQKAKAYRETYEKSVLAHPDLCLGSYAFTWGYKIEATSTWYGMFLPDKSKLAAVDTMQELWTGKAPANPCPVIEKLEMTSPDQVKAGDTISAKVEASDPSGEPVKIEWQLFREQSNYGVQGTGAAATEEFKSAIEKNGEKEVKIKVPLGGGIYRIYCYVHNSKGGAAVGSLPVKVKGIKIAFRAPAVPKEKFPFDVYSSAAEGEPNYYASGVMGSDMASLSIDGTSTDAPRDGRKKVMKVEYKSDKGWAGCFFQTPVNDWGKTPGGYDLTQADKLTFWARGAKGNESITFGVGGIDIKTRFHDSMVVDLKDVKLTKEWKQYTIDLTEFDLTCIRSGFRFSFGTKGEPITFYLDDIKFEVNKDE